MIRDTSATSRWLLIALLLQSMLAQTGCGYIAAGAVGGAAGAAVAHEASEDDEDDEDD